MNNAIDLFNRLDNNQVVNRVGGRNENIKNQEVNKQLLEFIGRGKYNPAQQVIFDKGNKKGYFMGRFFVNDKSSQSRVQSVAEDLKIKNYRKKKRPDLVIEIKQKIKDNSKKIKKDKNKIKK